MTDGTTITTTEYMGGFQYTNSKLDFFPHAEGYVKATPAGLGGNTAYAFNYTDHSCLRRGLIIDEGGTTERMMTGREEGTNRRLQYAQDPNNNNEVTILEEDHYYPYCLRRLRHEGEEDIKHRGYSSSHFVLKRDDGPGTGVVLTPVNPFLGDTYKYKFGGKEYQTEFDINIYDFGARNYDPALGRWMNIDPLAENYFEKSPYVYAGNIPTLFVDYDGRDFGIYIDHEKKTMEIKADYKTNKEGAKDLLSAIKNWNSLSGEFTYVTGDKESSEGYEINLNISFSIDENATKEDLQDFAQTLVNVEGNESNVFYKDNFETGKGGNATSTRIRVGSSDASEHEIGHTLGNTHINGGLMAEKNGGPTDIFASHFGEMLKQAGIGTGQLGPWKPANGYINGEKGERPVNFLSGSVVKTKKYERILNRKIRQEEKKKKG